MATTTRTNNSVILDEKKCALIQTTIWTNQGERGPFHTVTLRRSYKQNDEWKETKMTIGLSDLLTVARMLGWCHDRIHEELQA
jgi:hypothetical protein